MSSDAFQPISFKSGLTVKNRMVKAAMEENLATAEQTPGKTLRTLYEAWSKGGVGLIITGNVMVDHLAMTGPGGVVLEKNTDLQAFSQWAKSAKHEGTRAIMQINHPGRQVFKKMGGKVLSPSDVALNMGKHSGLFGQPKPMTEAEIQDVIDRFTHTAVQAKLAGFDGVQVHAAHGYLISQFLSPLVNKRQDAWGGSLENRAKLLLAVVDSIIEACGSDFSVSVKLNSADFQRGGFAEEDAQQVVSLLAQRHVDFVELSGGSYEAPAMQGRTADQRTLDREAYFLEFAEVIANKTSLPIMTTGGITKLKTVERVLASGVAMVGMASALASRPDLPNRWKSAPETLGSIPRVNWQDKTLSGLAVMAMVKRQLRQMGKGKTPKLNLNPAFTLFTEQLRSASLTKRYRKRYANQVK
ncbi:NADH:flavin oxidoreductase/NADH oxidase family protein [Aestuariibacter sp. AA17]|uniref:NADH:flavin oxidoreductase/NADH oxidase family protein n=1 Tax=Fluctibacter corallii TaxID=2984329 RepID=A0ABT3A5Q3_9ALTE|nr:NADH:flavin oxidoreductase/NADH oxidase family protein [Aestuariibacter sp. AA17]MCV2883884.1 NADH:flavin oxidoreductase/NADH oxidase family protein [Aestuariibacter sp. AA17]